MTTTDPTIEDAQVRNFYQCPKCSQRWQDVWSCACNDACPQCGCKDIEPLRSQSMDADKEIGAFSDAVKAFGVDRDSNIYAIAAAKHFASEGEIEIDDRTVVSRSEKGAYVMAWLYVSDEDLQAPS